METVLFESEMGCIQGKHIATGIDERSGFILIECEDTGEKYWCNEDYIV